MYAVIENGGKQYRVELGAELALDLFTADPGAKVDLGRVLLVADGDTAHIGTPVVEGAKVTAEVVRADRGEKLIVFKYRPKARRRVKKGHRQELTVVRVADIEWAGRSAAKEAAAEADKAQKSKAEAAKSAEAKAKSDAALADKLAADEKAAEKPKTEAKAKPAAKATAAKTAAAKPAAKPAAKATAKTTAKPKTEAKAEAKPRARTTKKAE
jgi:large subunit ribosomal protein L21